MLNTDIGIDMLDHESDEYTHVKASDQIDRIFDSVGFVPIEMDFNPDGDFTLDKDAIRQMSIKEKKSKKKSKPKTDTDDAPYKKKKYTPRIAISKTDTGDNEPTSDYVNEAESKIAEIEKGIHGEGYTPVKPYVDPEDVYAMCSVDDEHYLYIVRTHPSFDHYTISIWFDGKKYNVINIVMPSMNHGLFRSKKSGIHEYLYLYDDLEKELRKYIDKDKVAKVSHFILDTKIEIYRDMWICDYVDHYVNHDDPGKCSMLDILKEYVRVKCANIISDPCMICEHKVYCAYCGKIRRIVECDEPQI